MAVFNIRGLFLPLKSESSQSHAVADDRQSRSDGQS